MSHSGQKPGLLRWAGHLLSLVGHFHGGCIPHNMVQLLVLGGACVPETASGGEPSGDT